MKKGRLYTDGEWELYQQKIKHPFHDTEETFEVYECPNPDCGGHFLVESEAIESVERIWCPYCKFEFTEAKGGEIARQAETWFSKVTKALKILRYSRREKNGNE